MAEFIEFEAYASDSSGSENEMEQRQLDINMIDDDENLQNNEPSFFRFYNQTTDPEQIEAQVMQQQQVAALDLEPHNYLEVGEDEDDYETDDEACVEINEKKIEATLKNTIFAQTKENSFISALIYGTNYFKNKELNVEYTDEEITNKIGAELFDKIKFESEICILDLDKINFDNMCLTINDILIPFGFFLRIYEKNSKFRYLLHRTEEKNETIKSISSCLRTNFNGFSVAVPYLENQKKENFIQ